MVLGAWDRPCAERSHHSFGGQGYWGSPNSTSASCQAFYSGGPAEGKGNAVPRVSEHPLPSPCGFLPGCSCSSPGCCTTQHGCRAEQARAGGAGQGGCDSGMKGCRTRGYSLGGTSETPSTARAAGDGGVITGHTKAGVNEMGVQSPVSAPPPLEPLPGNTDGLQRPLCYPAPSSHSSINQSIYLSHIVLSPQRVL